MFYLIQLYLNVNDKVQPFTFYTIINSYKTHDEAFSNFSIYADHEIFPFNTDSHVLNTVTDYEIDIFNNYHQITLIIKSDSYDECLDTLDKWALDYLNDIWKTKWIEDQLKDLPTWYVILGNEVPEFTDAPINILSIELIPESMHKDMLSNEVDDMLSGWYNYIPTNLSHVIVAKEYLSKDTITHYELVIQANNEEEVEEVCHDFLRLYVDEHK